MYVYVVELYEKISTVENAKLAIGLIIKKNVRI